MRNRNKQIRKALSVTDYGLPKDTLKDKEKIKKEKNTKSQTQRYLSRDLLKTKEKKNP